MKITAKKYADALLQATEGKTEKEVKEIISRMIDVMAANKDLNRYDLVIKYFKKAWNAENGLVVVDVTTANEVDKATSKELNSFITKMLNAEKVEIRSKIDKGILGGVIIKQGDTIYDGSLRSRLYSLKEQLSK